MKPLARLRQVIVSRRLEELVGESLRLGRYLRRARLVMGLGRLIALLGLLLLGSA